MTTTPDTPPVDEFADAFATLQAAENPVAKVETPVPAPAVASTPAAVETPAPAGDPPAPAEPAVPVDPDAPADAVKPAPVVSEPPDLAAQLAAVRAELVEARKAPVAPVAPVAPAPVVETPAPPPVYTADEQATLAKYQEDWPDVVKGEALTRRAEYQGLINHVFESLRPTIEALQESAQKNSSRTQYSDLVSLVPDYPQVREPTLAWIETQPGFLKKAYQDVAANGSAEDVAHLIERFKKETNYVAPVATDPPVATDKPVATTPAAARTVPPARTTLPAAAAAAATSLKVVKSSRTEPVTAPDPNDFDAAFAEFASKTN
jgi:hypothetical protein